MIWIKVIENKDIHTKNVIRMKIKTQIGIVSKLIKNSRDEF